MAEREKKFGLPVVIFASLFIILSDLGDITCDITLAIPVLGEITCLAAKGYSFVIWLLVQFWLIMKRERGLWFLGGSIVDLIGIPLAQTATFFITVFIANHPKLAKVAGKATAATGGATGKTARQRGGAPHAAGGAGRQKTGRRFPAEQAPTYAAGAPGGVTASSGGSERPGTPHGQQRESAYQEEAQAPEPQLARADVSEEAFGMPKDPFGESEELFTKTPGARNVSLNGNEINLKNQKE